MELLDNDSNEITDPKGRQFALFGSAFLVIGALASLIAFAFGLEARSILNTNGAPDALALSKTILVRTFAGLLAFPTLIIGIVLSFRAFYKHNFNEIWLWRVLLVCGLTVLISSFIPFDLISLILAFIILIHVITRKSHYATNDEFENE